MFILLGWWAIFDLVGIKIWTSVLELRFRECEIGLGCGGPRPRFAPPSDSVLTFVASRLLQSSITIHCGIFKETTDSYSQEYISNSVTRDVLHLMFTLPNDRYSVCIYIYIILVPRQR